MNSVTNSTSVRAGILGIGLYLPDAVRRNDWWPETVIQRWREKAMHRVESLPVARTAGIDAALAAMHEFRDDLFNGAHERRVMASEQLSSDMETEAAKLALEEAGVDASEIDGLISYTMCPDFLAGPTGGAVHQKLALSNRCYTVSVEGACNSFALQLTLAEQAIRSGSMKRVLLVTSSAYSRLMPMESPMSPWLGDGAAAVVVGPVSDGHGILSSAHGTASEGYKAMVFGIPGKRWYEDGRVVGYAEDRAMAQAIILGAPDRCQEVVNDALAKVGLTPADVDFYAGHQGGPWMRRVTQDVAGMTRARYLDTYKAFGNLGAANIPFILALAGREGLLRAGDTVATFSAGTGQTYASFILKWGR